MIRLAETRHAVETNPLSMPSLWLSVNNTACPFQFPVPQGTFGQLVVLLFNT